MKLNLGCGGNKLPDHVNVDKYGEPDVKQDLEQFPWPWPDSSVDQVTMSHVLEHLGAAPDVFIGVMKELYRVCKGGARILIVVPHPRHDNYIGDPTHVRPVTPQMLSLFDAEQCRAWQEKGFSNTPLALYHGVDFRMVECVHILDWKYDKVPPEQAQHLIRDMNNVCVEIRMVLEVRK